MSETDLRPEFRRFYDALERFLRDHVDPNAIDELGALWRNDDVHAYRLSGGGRCADVPVS